MTITTSNSGVADHALSRSRPHPTGVTFTPSKASLPDNAPAGTTVAVVSVAMSDGSAFSGTLAASPAGTVAISGNKLVLARGLTSADVGAYQWKVAATQNGVTVSGTIPVQITVASPPPTPKSVTFTPSGASLPDNTATGTTVAAISVAMSDGSAFSGSLAASPAGTVAMSGNKLVLARGLTPADDGAHQWGVNARQNGVTVSGTVQVQVTAIPTTVTLTPTAAPLPDNAAAGTVVDVVSVAMSDGSVFSGSFAASPAGTVAMSGNQLVLSRALSPADDGAHQWIVSATQNGVTVSGIIQVQITATPSAVTFTPTTASLPDNSAAGTTVAAVSVSMSNGSAFSGTLAASTAGTVATSGNLLVLARGLTPADDGSHQWQVSATQNGVTISGAIQVQVTATLPPSDQLTTDDGSAILSSDDGSSFLMVS